MADLREALRNSMERIGLKSQQYIDNLINEMLKLDVKDVDVEKFNTWFNIWIRDLKPEKITSLGRYFQKIFEKQLIAGTFNKTSNTSSREHTDELTPEPTESFEASWDEWCTLIRGLSLNPEMPSSPSMGVLISDSNNRVRAVSDGVGGMVYIDGTISERFKKYEDLDIQERQDLYAAVERLHSKQLGCELVLKRMSQLGGSINEQA